MKFQSKSSRNQIVTQIHLLPHPTITAKILQHLHYHQIPARNHPDLTG